MLKTKSNIHKTICSPYSSIHSNIQDSCYTDDDIISIKDAWNKRHPSRKINDENPSDIWKKLNKNMKTECKNERCWLRKLIKNNELKVDIDTTTFAPERPKEWRNNPKEWLSNYDISNVLSQYEDIYQHFRLIGPTPLNYDEINEDTGDYVWPELNYFNLDDYISQNVTDIAIVFNLDDHDEEGSHWITLYIDIPGKRILHFDSAAGTIPKKVKKLVDKIKNNSQEKMILSTNYPLEHQKRDGECGVYSIYFILSMLHKSKDWNDFRKKRITDKEMFEYRDELFN
jgi:hypothetical protein